MTRKNKLATLFDGSDDIGENPMQNVQDKVLSSSLADRVAELAASLGMGTPKGNAPYEPDAFLSAVTHARDELRLVADSLEAQNAAQRAREATLAAREEAVTFREKRMDAYEKLKAVPSRPWWRFW